ncbi:MAG TPA: hypothetical protein VGB83_05910 [Actinomycetota bacterium]
MGLLALAWAVLLLPSALRPRFETSPVNGVREFERSMGILANARSQGGTAPGRWVMSPKGIRSPRTRRQRVMARRRRVFVRLLWAALVTLALGIVPAMRVVLVAHLALDAALVLYVMQLRRWHLEEERRARVVRPLPSRDQAPARPDTMSQLG